MKKIPKKYLLAATAVLGVGGLFFGARILFLKKERHSFDGPAFVQEQESELEALRAKCDRTKPFSLRECQTWAEVSTAWSSESTTRLGQLWNQNCAAGQEESCRKWEMRRRLQAQPPQYWSRRQLESGGTRSWPAILELQQPLAAKDWLEIGFEGVVHGAGSSYDLVCGNSVELPDTLICASHGNVRINTAIGRAVSYIEQGKKLLSIGEHTRNPLLRFWQGTNLIRGDFDYAAKLLKETSPLLPEEESLWNWLDGKRWKYLITFNSFSVFSGIPSHEFLHGVYFSNPQYRDVVDGVLKSKSSLLKPVNLFLDRIFDTSDEYIRNNEIQAYLLQHRSFLNGKKSQKVREDLLSEISKIPMNLDVFRQGF